MPPEGTTSLMEVGCWYCAGTSPPCCSLLVLSLLLQLSSSIKFHSLHTWNELTQKVKAKLVMVHFLWAVRLCLLAYAMLFIWLPLALWAEPSKLWFPLTSGFYTCRTVAKGWRCARSHQLIGDEQSKRNTDHVQFVRPGARRRRRMVKLLPIAYYWMTRRILSALDFLLLKQQPSTSEFARNR